jgi:SPP1 gp7 family putative phage head morphogenesis protein
MTWRRAFEADARLAARNAVKIRAALRQSINAEAIAEGYLASLPPTTGNLSQSRARARAWAIMNVRVNLEPLRAVLLRTLAEAYVLGTIYAEEQVGLARARRKSVATGVNWDTWRPGDEAAAILVKPPKAFQTLLGRYGLTLKGFSDTTLNDIGNSLGESLELGLSASQMAKRLGQYVASPSRALSIAVTEQNRAISVATVARYKEMGVEKQEWIASDPCDECEQNDGEIVRVGAPFSSGDTEPPVHPNCRCALLPVILGMEDVTEPYITQY